jgi:uncharacterized protein YbjT (DUF2867 family)
MNTRPHDIVAFGATGFVGKLLCRYLATLGSSSKLKWAAAARSREKLEALRHFLGPVPLLIADAEEERSIAAMCAKARVVVLTERTCDKFSPTIEHAISTANQKESNRFTPIAVYAQVDGIG